MSERVVVVGGGLQGCSLALELARRGRAVTVLERAIPGAEASSAAAGILAPRMEAHGQEPLRSLGVRSLELYPGWVEELRRRSGVDPEHRNNGLLRLVQRGEDPAQLQPDLEAVWWTAAELRRAEPAVAPRLQGAWRLPTEGVVDTRRLVDAAHLAARSAGAEFHTGVAVEAVWEHGVRLVDGVELHGTVVVCAGAWTGKVPGLGALPVRPVRGQLASLRPADLPGHTLFLTGGYLVPRPDGRLIVGTTVEDVGFTRGVTVAGVSQVLATAAKALPAVGDAELLECWSGFRPTTPDHLPILGEVEGVWVSSGHYRNGILLAPLSARLLADALLEGAPLPTELGPQRFGSVVRPE